jgi:hypothetical protein
LKDGRKTEDELQLRGAWGTAELPLASFQEGGKRLLTGRPRAWRGMDLPSRLKIRYYPSHQLCLEGVLGCAFQTHGHFKGCSET